MNVVLTNILEDLRGLYTISDRLKRFDAYVSLSSGKARGEGRTRGEPLPLGTFSPMGEQQTDYLDRLIAIGAEGLAQATAAEVAADFATLKDSFRLMLVVADVPRNGWTERGLTDAEWRFTLKNDTPPKVAAGEGFDRWVSVLLWTDTEATEAYINREVRAALYRALHLRYLAAPHTLADMTRQEGRALAYAGYTPTLGAEELAYTRAVVKPFLQSTDFPVCFASLYGDDAARQVGYEALGLTAAAGFQLALHDALAQNDASSALVQAGKQNRRPAI